MHTVNHTENIIEIDNVSFGYNNHEVLRGITLTVHRGDYLALVGGNGAGKTTLLKIILGLLTPASGSVKLFGEHLRDFKDWQKIGFVPQHVTNFDVSFPATVEEVVLMGRYGRKGLFKPVTEDDKKKALNALLSVEMEKYKGRLIGDLSGGQQQRVFIARALAGDPEIIFLDEPTVGVEKYIKEEFYALLKKLNEEMNLTVVLVTHDIESMAHEAMHVACIDTTLVFHTSVDGFLESTHGVNHANP